MNRIYYLLLLIFCFASCRQGSTTEVYQNNRDNIIDVKESVREIDFGNVAISNSSRLLLADEYLVVADYKEFHKPIHVFDKKTFKHVVSFGEIGQGPNEITSMGDLHWNEKEREIYVRDAGRNVIDAFDVDSLVSNENYLFYEKFHLGKQILPTDFFMFNDSVAYAFGIIPKTHNSFDEATYIWNLRSGEKKILDYIHPETHKKRYSLAVSFSDSIYVECNYLYDLISVFNLEGKLIKNIYGPQWGTSHLQCFSRPLFARDYLIVLYSGETYENSSFPKQCMVFSKHGDHVATLDMKCYIHDMCYDQEFDRLIFTFDDDIQFGYLDLKDLKLK